MGSFGNVWLRLQLFERRSHGGRRKREGCSLELANGPGLRWHCRCASSELVNSETMSLPSGPASASSPRHEEAGTRSLRVYLLVLPTFFQRSGSRNSPTHTSTNGSSLT